jgi:hypothetical protein
MHSNRMRQKDSAGKEFVLSSSADDLMTAYRMKALLVSQGFDGIKIGSFSGRVIAKADSDQG